MFRKSRNWFPTGTNVEPESPSEAVIFDAVQHLHNRDAEMV